MMCVEDNDFGEKCTPYKLDNLTHELCVKKDYPYISVYKDDVLILKLKIKEAKKLLVLLLSAFDIE